MALSVGPIMSERALRLGVGRLLRRDLIAERSHLLLDRLGRLVPSSVTPRRRAQRRRRHPTRRGHDARRSRFSHRRMRNPSRPPGTAGSLHALRSPAAPLLRRTAAYIRQRLEDQVRDLGLLYADVVSHARQHAPCAQAGRAAGEPDFHGMPVEVDQSWSGADGCPSRSRIQRTTPASSRFAQLSPARR